MSVPASPGSLVSRPAGHASAPDLAGSALEPVREAWRRHRGLGLAVWFVVFSAALALAVFLPDLYRASSTVLVEQQTAPGSPLEARLHSLSEQILSRALLRDLIDRYNLYPAERRHLSPDAVVAQMRRDIRLEPKDGTPGGTAASGSTGATIALAIGYRGPDARAVASVANELASSLVERDTAARKRQTTATVELLRGQMETARQRMEEEGRRMGAFNMRHLAELPQQRATNLASLERVTSQLRLNAEQQMRLSERRDAALRPVIVPVPGGTAGVAESPASRLARLRIELTELRTRFSDKYPDVVRTQHEIALLEREGAGRPPTREAAPPTTGAPAGVAEIDAELGRLRAEAARLRESVPLYQSRLENAPRREEELRGMTRDYDAAREAYLAAAKRHDEAVLADSLDERQRPQSFRVLDVAIAAREPVAPNRSRILIVGAALATGLAAGAVLVARHLDTSFHALRDLRAFTRLPVLASIPLIVTDADRARRRHRLWLRAAAATATVALVVGAMFLFAAGNHGLVLRLAGPA